MSNVPSVGDADTVALLENVFVCFNSHDPAKFRAFCSDDFQFHDASKPSPVEGRDLFVAALKEWWKAFPDSQITGKMIIASGNWAAAEATVTGTHQGDFKGIPGTGKSVGWTFMEIAEFKDGKLRALRAYRDNVNIYKQLGVLPLNL